MSPSRSTDDPVDEDVRARRLVEAEEKAVMLFDEVVERGLIAPGEPESVVSARVRDLGAELFGTSKHWHKRIVRSGPNTLRPYRENPPDRTLGDDDIVFLDFGPVFEEWEADLGRTYVLGDDPVKHRLHDDLPRVFDAGCAYFDEHPGVTGAELYAHVLDVAHAAGWAFGGWHAGHLVGEFPHELREGEKVENYITTGNDRPLRQHLASGRLAHWILEIHLVDHERDIGGFYEQLLTLHRDPASS